MSKILVVGNILKDVYLKLDERTNVFESGKDGKKWMDVCFDSSVHHVFRRTATFGGAAVSQEVLSAFGQEVKISGSSISFDNDGVIANEKSFVSDYRYILCADSDATYFVPSEQKLSIFEPPTEPVDFLYIDRSAKIDAKTFKDIESYLETSGARLILYVSKHSSKYFETLAKRAELIFTETEDYGVNPDKIIRVADNKVSYKSQSVEWQTDRTDLSTHLTIYSIVAATIIGAFLQNKPPHEALNLARINVENSLLNEVLEPSRLEQIVQKEQAELADLRLMAASLVAPGKGILAADESGGSIHKKFESMNIPDDEAHRRDYRNIFLSTHDLEKHVNGVILFDETARQHADNGDTFVDYLTSRGIIPGIKVDQGLEKFEDSDEKWTKGLDGLSKRLREYYQMGLRFAKWRAAFEVTDHTPSARAIIKNCSILAEYAKKCQKEHIVPIVEPEVVYDGDYPIKKSARITQDILELLFLKLRNSDVDLGACILKVNMVLAGKKQSTQSTPEEVGRATAEVLRKIVPEELAGVVFLSGGQSVEQATANLQAVTNEGPFPWPVTFSFARALQDPALMAWRGDNNNREQASEAFYQRLVANTEALKKK